MNIMRVILKRIIELIELRVDDAGNKINVNQIISSGKCITFSHPHLTYLTLLPPPSLP